MFKTHQYSDDEQSDIRCSWLEKCRGVRHIDAGAWTPFTDLFHSHVIFYDVCEKI